MVVAAILWVGLKTRTDWGESLFRFKMAGKEYKFEDFLHFTVTSLQDFLSLRGLSKSGKEDELVARAFGAYELNDPVKIPPQILT